MRHKRQHAYQPGRCTCIKPGHRARIPVVPWPGGLSQAPSDASILLPMVCCDRAVDTCDRRALCATELYQKIMTPRERNETPCSGATFACEPSPGKERTCMASPSACSDMLQRDAVVGQSTQSGTGAGNHQRKTHRRRTSACSERNGSIQGGGSPHN